MNLHTKVRLMEQHLRALELKVLELEEKLEKQKVTPSPKKLTRVKARDLFFEEVRKNCPDVSITVGNRVSGCDFIVKRDLSEKKGKFYYSKPHRNPPHSWHTVKESDFLDENIHFYVFMYYVEEKNHIYIYKRDEMLDFIKNKKMDNSQLYHFYFKEGSEIRDNGVECGSFYQKWSAFTQ